MLDDSQAEALAILAHQLIRDAGALRGAAQLLADRNVDAETGAELREILERKGDLVTFVLRVLANGGSPAAALAERTRLVAESSPPPS
jgi:nitrogen-specific signal transduction histidine kinase